MHISELLYQNDWNVNLLKKKANKNFMIKIMLSKDIMEVKTSCRFQNFGFCNFIDNCRFRNAHNVCQKQICDLKNCPAGHPKKFGEKCHQANQTSAESEIKIIEEEVQSLKVENKRLK